LIIGLWKAELPKSGPGLLCTAGEEREMITLYISSLILFSYTPAPILGSGYGRQPPSPRAMNTIECVQSKKSRYEVIIQSEAKPQKKGSSDTECIQSDPPTKTPFSQEKKTDIKKRERTSTRERERQSEQ
jgi:hypothetical protein